MAKEIELIFIPVPSMGHLLVNIEFAKRLIDLDNRIKTITIVLFNLPTSPHASVFARSLIVSQPRIRIHDLPSLHDHPSTDLYRRAPEAYVVQVVKLYTPLVKEAVSEIVESRRCDSDSSVRVAGLVLDFFCNSLIGDVGKKLNLDSYIFLTCNARYLSMMKYLPDRNRKIGSEFDLRYGDEELPIPGFVYSVPAKFMPPGLYNREAYEAYVDLAPKFGDAKGILVNSFAELESHPFEYFSKQEDYPPVYPVGPILSLKDRANPNEEAADKDRIMEWLDDQPESSVLFLCFGSKGSVKEPQVKEIARALELVGCRFLWAFRTDSLVETDPNDALPDGFMDRVAGKGLVCGWAPQVEVLDHKAIRGFVSHCGWNSTLESLWFGVPLATWPMYAEQQLNAFTLVKELELAVDLRMDYVSSRGGLVTCDEIVRAVRSLMDDIGEGLRRKVKEMGDAARKAVMDGGSSSLATARFIDELVDNGSC
ncbi:udp-glucoronosyl udp-glucosyl transferase family protein [Arabis alpina]|uniref:Glycosyltransferase n=1 Tax=Arabis alpina TaxID=50452 RepID=A0A087HLQ2_ARAAL|nr:udp-glucoronosyl udp-glucosyl transferase family protein [Arabis alpina]